jgi:hypothetical protein
MEALSREACHPPPPRQSYVRDAAIVDEQVDKITVFA